MEGEGEARFLKKHQGSVRGVAFHPRDRYIFCSGAYDGKVNIYSAQKYEHLRTYGVTTVSLARNINGVRFSADGTKILATTTARRLAVLDVEHGDQIMAFDNCAFNGRDRTGLALDPHTPHVIACCAVNGKGLTLFDLRMSHPLDFLYDMHSGIIRDVTFLHGSWPWGQGHSSILTVAADGICKVSTIDGRLLHAVDVGQPLNCVCPTPEPFNSTLDDGFTSLIVMGGDTVSAYVPEAGIQESLNENQNAPIWKMRYTAHGSTLYTACDRGIIRRYRRWPDHHGYLGEVFQHRLDVQDMDISPYDEYIVTASKDRSVGVIKLGGPNHGCTEYAELT